MAHIFTQYFAILIAAVLMLVAVVFLIICKPLRQIFFQ
jgi:hypothetical protein